MVKTRSRVAKRKSAGRRAVRSARRSTCKNKGPAACRGTKGCKYASGKKRSFCRKVTNKRRLRSATRRRQRGGNGDIDPQ